MQASNSFEYSQFAKNESKTMYGMVSFSTDEPTTYSNFPLDLVCVVDTSGSMGGEKIEMVKKTLQFMTEQLKPTDSLSIVTFSSNSNVVLKRTFIDDNGLTRANTAIQNVRVDGMTNLSAGLFTGFDQISSDDKRVQSILLFTDGDANKGITDNSTIKREMESKLVAGDVSVNTFGFGNDYNETLLETIANTGKGSCYHLQKASDIPELFGSCLGGLLTVMVKNIEFTLMPKFDTALHSVETNYKFKKNSNGFDVHVNNLYRDEEQYLLYTLTLPKVAQSQTMYNPIEINIKYAAIKDNVLGTEAIKCVINYERPDVCDTLSVNIKLNEQRNRLASVTALNEAKEFGSQDKLEQARKVVQDCIDAIKLSPSGHTLFCKELVQTLEDTHKGFKNTHTYNMLGSRTATCYSNNLTQQRGFQYSTPAMKTMQQKCKSKVFASSSSSGSHDSHSNTSYGGARSSYNSPQYKKPQGLFSSLLGK
jgi:uncharacterized protein YegL